MKNFNLSCVKKYFFAMLSVFAVSLLAVFSQTYAADIRPSLSGLQDQITELQNKIITQQSQIQQQQTEINLNKRVIGLDTSWRALNLADWIPINFEGSNTSNCSQGSQTDEKSRCLVHLELLRWVNNNGEIYGGPLTLVHDGSQKNCEANWIMDYIGKNIKVVYSPECISSPPNPPASNSAFIMYRIVVELLPPRPSFPF